MRAWNKRRNISRDSLVKKKIMFKRESDQLYPLQILNKEKLQHSFVNCVTMNL